MARILFVSTSTTIGGAEKTLHALATTLDPAAHSVAGVISLKPEGDYARRLRDQGVSVRSLGLTRTPRPSDIARLSEIITRERPDIVHAFMYQAVQLCRLAKTRTPVPFKLISSPRVTYRTRSIWTLLIDRALKSRDDLLISECGASRDFLVHRLGYPEEKTLVIRNGVDTTLWRADEDARRRRRRELSLRDDEILVGAAGRLDRQKGFATLISAMDRIRTAPVRCLILGDGPERARLESLVRQFGLQASVTLAGEQGESASWLSAFDIFCLPSLWEGLPNSVLEAMAIGLPVTACAVDGVPEAVEDGKTGLLVPAENPEALSQALRSLASDPLRRAAFGAAALKTVQERFGLRRMIEEYRNAYTAVLGR
ncbi:MAG: glycosyltransferase [Elusimicrobiota bacterium]